jgi:hypothetical protein
MRHDCLFLAEVVDNQDLSGLGRVKLLVPGLLEPSSLWAFPIGRMYGEQEGIHWVPRVGSNGCLWLNQGHPDHPYFLAGPWGSPKTGPDVHPAALTGGLADPDKFVFAWDQFHVLIDGGAAKVFFVDEVTGSTFEFDRATGDLTQTITGPMGGGNETHTILGNLSTTLQEGNLSTTVTAGNETRTITAGSRTTTIGTTDTLTALARTTNVTAADSLTVGGARTETVGAASTETVAGAKSITSLGLSLTSTGAGLMAVTGAMVETFLGAFTRKVAGVLSDTVTGLYTLTAIGGCVISGTPITLGIPANALKLLNSLYHSTVFVPHTHVAPSGGGTTSGPSLPSGPTLTAAETTDVTAS